MNPDGKMRLAAYFNPTGHHVASWRHPRAQADAHINIKHYVEIAQTAERAKFDLIFLADGVATRQADIEAQSRSVQFIAHFEPITLLSALAMVTERIGLIATMSTSYNEPYHVARKFASLDHISGGRSGWNLVTSGQMAEALNFNRTEPFPHHERYQRAHEFAEVVRACGIAGTTTRSCATRTADCSSSRTRCITSITRGKTIRCAARSTCRVRRRASRCLFRPVRPTTARSSPPNSPRRFSVRI